MTVRALLVASLSLSLCACGGDGSPSQRAAADAAGGEDTKGSPTLPPAGASSGLPAPLPPAPCVPGCSAGFACVDHACVREGAPACNPACDAGWACRDGVCEPEALKSQHSGGGESWTVLVYMAADNNLEPFALQDLQEMMEVGASKGFQLVVQVDRAKGCQSKRSRTCNEDRRFRGGFEGTRRYVVAQGALEQLADLGETDTGSPASLAEFIAWGATSFPADRTALVLWDHEIGRAHV